LFISSDLENELSPILRRVAFGKKYVGSIAVFYNKINRLIQGFFHRSQNSICYVHPLSDDR